MFHLSLIMPDFSGEDERLLWGRIFNGRLRLNEAIQGRATLMMSFANPPPTRVISRGAPNRTTPW